MMHFKIRTSLLLIFCLPHFSWSIELYPNGLRNRKHKQEVVEKNGWASQETFQHWQRRVHLDGYDKYANIFTSNNPNFAMNYTLFKQVVYYLFDPDFKHGNSTPDYYECDSYGFRFHPSFPTGGCCTVYDDPVTPLEVIREANEEAKAIGRIGNAKPNYLIIEYSRGEYVRRLISPEGRIIPLILLPSGHVSGPPCAYNPDGTLKAGWHLRQECWHAPGHP